VTSAIGSIFAVVVVSITCVVMSQTIVIEQGLLPLIFLVTLKAATSVIWLNFFLQNFFAAE
jgi:hypothetical protein